MQRSELEQRLEAHHAESFGWAMACCHRDREDAEEVLQIAYLKVLEGRARFDERSSFRTWFFAVIRRTALERFRWKRVRRIFELVTAAALRADEQIEQDETAARLLASLRRLPRRQREVLDLVFYHDMTIEEAARTLEIALGTARVHYERGKKRLLQMMTEEERVVFA